MDNLLKFDREGNCTIHCPKQCAKKTFIRKDQTTNDLGIDYMMKGILDMVNAKNNVPPRYTTCLFSFPGAPSGSLRGYVEVVSLGDFAFYLNKIGQKVTENKCAKHANF